MNDVDQLLEKKQMARDSTDARSNQNAVKAILLQCRSDNSLGRLTKVNMAMLRVIAESP